MARKPGQLQALLQRAWSALWVQRVPSRPRIVPRAFPDSRRRQLEGRRRNDFLHVYGSYNIEEVEVLQMSTKLKIGRRYIIPMEDFCIGGDGILKEGTNTNHMQSNEGQSVPPEGEGTQRKGSQDCKPKRISTIPSNDSVEGLVSNIASTLRAWSHSMRPPDLEP